MADERVEIEIVLDNGKVVKGFRKVEKQAKKTADKSEKFLKAGFAAAVVGVAGIAAAIAGTAKLFSAGIAAARQQEDALNKFNTALKLSGKFTKEVSKDFQDFASELQRTTKIGDELTLETAALIQGLGQLEGEALKEATLAAADLSAALGIDLKAAALLVGKAAAGEVSSFSRYGLVIQKGANNAETFTKALTAIQGKFGGSAAAQVLTFSGAVEQLGNAFGDSLEGVGDLVIKLPVFSSIIKKVSVFFLDLADSIKDFTGSAAKIADLNNAVIDFGQNIVTFLIVPVEAVIQVFDAAWLSLRAGFEVTLAFLSTSVQGYIELLNLIPGVDIDTSGFEAVATGAEDTAIRANEALARIGQFDEGSFSVQLSESLEGFKTTAEEVQTTMDGLDFSKPAEEAKKLAFEFKITGKQVATGISQGVQQAVKNAKSGGNALEGFFGGFLAFIGNWAIQTGTTLIGVGLGIEALKTSIVGLTGGPAIAAGIALVALGTLLSGLSSGGSTAQAAGGGVASDVGTDSGQIAVASEAEEVEERETKVAINVEGTVLDPVGVGNAIADILNETFEAGGTRVVTV
jgi:hypothetical protein